MARNGLCRCILAPRVVPVYPSRRCLALVSAAPLSGAPLAGAAPVQRYWRLAGSSRMGRLPNTRTSRHPPFGGTAEVGAASTALPRLDIELRLLFSRYTPAPDDNFFSALRIELGRRAWSLEHAIGAPRPADPALPTVHGAESDLEKLRARLVAEVNLGLTMVETAPIRFSRPVRNVLLARHAGHIGRCLAELLRHPGAGPLAAELQHLLDTLQRRM